MKHRLVYNMQNECLMALPEHTPVAVVLEALGLDVNDYMVTGPIKWDFVRECEAFQGNEKDGKRNRNNT